MTKEELEKENAELKEKNTALRQAWDVMKSTITDYDNLLTKAREIINEYINILKGDTKNWKNTQKKVLGTIINYRNGDYLYSVILGFCTGMIFINIGWLILQKVEE